MVSQSQDAIGWDGNGSPSRTGSLLSLDGRQRPAPAKTPPSYYDAVRSRHSLSQPRPSDGNKPDKGHPGQQVKYNSLPRPLPQRYPPTTANGHPPQQQHRPWPDDQPYDPSRANNNHNNNSGSWRPPGDPAARLYDSPPKPANHVPLQLQLHTAQDRYLLKRGGPEQAEGAPRANGSGPRADGRLTVDCGGARGGPMEMMRKDSVRSLPPCSPDARSPPAVPPGGRIAHPRMPPSHGEHSTNSLQRRDLNQAPGLLRRYTMSPDGSPVAPSNYPPRMPANGLVCEPRYSKSGKMCTRPLSQGFESRPLPPPAVQLRTGRLGIYDAETLKRSEMANGGRSSYDDFNNNNRQTPQRAPGDISQQIYVDTNSSFAGGSTAIVATADHLAIPYRIPQLSPKTAFDGMEGRKEAPPGVAGRGPPPVLPNGVHHNQQQDHHLADHRNRRFHDTVQYSSDGLQPYAVPHAYKKHPPSPDAIYANHLVPNGLNGHGPSADHRSVQKRSPPMLNGNASAFYENHVPKNGPRDVQDVDTALYANQRVASTRYKSPQPEIASPVFPNGGENGFSNFRSPGHGSSQKIGNQHPPPPQKPRPTLPQPSDMIMVTETRGWNGQASSYPAKDVVVKPTPRMPPRFAANVASGTPLTSVPAYQCVINELSGQNGHQAALLPRNPSSDSSTLSLRSGYDSSSSSVRDFGRQPSKSDSSIDMRKLSEGGLKSAGSQPRIDKNFLSASMTSLCSDTSSSISTRRYHRYHHDDPNWDRMNEEYNKRKDKGSVFSASPWEREEKEKLQREQLLDARRARDQEIALLEAMPDRSEKQEEWLRILRLEREFQRRAEQEDDDEEEEEDDDVIGHQEKQVGGGEENGAVESFHGDKVNSIPNERLGRKLLDELHEDSSKSPTDKQEFSRSPSEKHFIPLERTISGSFTQGLSLPTGISSGQTPDQKHSEQSASRLQKPPIPAPRPSKTSISSKSDDPCQVFDSDGYVHQSEPVPKAAMESTVRNLSKIDISDAGFYRGGSDEIGRRDCLQADNNWLIEVASFEESQPSSKQQNGENHREESRIYENIMEFQHGRQNHPPSSHNGYGSHTLPKPNLSAPKDVPRSPKGHPEKKFPAMGLTSTLSRKLNGHIPSDSDILPALYASSKVKNGGYQKDIPSELEDKSPEFKKLWISKPEKLTFQDKIRKFSLQAGEDDVPRDRVKNSRAQREIEIKFNEGQKKSASTSSEA